MRRQLAALAVMLVLVLSMGCAFKYVEKNDYSLAVSVVVLDGSNWNILKVVPPK